MALAFGQKLSKATLPLVEGAVDLSKKTCDNCRGRGHLAKDCPSPQMCACCASVEHKKVDCPVRTKNCDLCGKPGHVKATCGLAFAAGTFGKGRCDNCRGMGHFAVNCSSAPECKCCGSHEHQKADCPAREKVCDLCGKPGHLRAKCTSAGRLFEYGGAGGKGGGKGFGAPKECFCCGSWKHQKWDCYQKDKACELCGEVGHLKHMCKGGAANKGKGKGMPARTAPSAAKAPAKGKGKFQGKAKVKGKF